MARYRLDYQEAEDIRSIYERQMKREKETDSSVITITTEGMHLLESIVRKVIREELEALLLRMIGNLAKEKKDPWSATEEKDFSGKKKKWKQQPLEVIEEKAQVVVDYLKERKYAKAAEIKKMLEQRGYRMNKNYSLELDRYLKVEPRIKKVGRGTYSID